MVAAFHLKSVISRVLWLQQGLTPNSPEGCLFHFLCLSNKFSKFTQRFIQFVNQIDSRFDRFFWWKRTITNYFWVRVAALMKFCEIWSQIWQNFDMKFLKFKFWKNLQNFVKQGVKKFLSKFGIYKLWHQNPAKF